MKLVIIFGPPAVGKMTVGKELSKITGLKLFHNHMSLELVNQFFDFGSSSFNRLDKKIRFSIFEEVANSNLEGIIFTIVWAFNEPDDWKYISDIEAIFNKVRSTIYYVELIANLEERLKRNTQEDRLVAKPSKRDVKFSEKTLLHHEKIYRMNSKIGELKMKNYVKIDNTNLDPIEMANIIKVKFGL